MLVTCVFASYTKNADSDVADGTLTVINGDVTNILITGVAASGTATNSLEIADKGICIGTKANPTVDLIKYSGGSSSNGTFTASATRLMPGTLYYYRAYATTPAKKHSLWRAKAIYNYSRCAALCYNRYYRYIWNSGFYNELTISDCLYSGDNMTEYSIVYNNGITLPTVNDSKNYTTGSINGYANTIGFNMSTIEATYNVRTYAKIAGQYIYGNVASFTFTGAGIVPAKDLPRVDT